MQARREAGLPWWVSGEESVCAGVVGSVPEWVRRKCQPTPVFLPEKSHGQRSLASYSPRGCKYPT